MKLSAFEHKSGSLNTKMSTVEHKCESVNINVNLEWHYITAEN